MVFTKSLKTNALWFLKPYLNVSILDKKELGLYKNECVYVRVCVCVNM